MLGVVTSLAVKGSPVPNEPAGPAVPRAAGRERAACSHHLFLTFIRNIFT